MDLLLHSPQLFHLQKRQQYASVLLLSTLIRAERTERLKQLKMRHDERGSQLSAGCGQVKRRELPGTAEGRRAGWRFLISAEPLLQFPEHDAAYCGGKGKHTQPLWI